MVHRTPFCPRWHSRNRSEEHYLPNSPCDGSRRIGAYALHCICKGMCFLLSCVASGTYFPLQDVNSSQNWPIGTNKTSCQMCWLLHQIYNKRCSSKFILAGTHGTFTPWLPPPGLLNAIMLELREALLVTCKNLASAHPRPSSKGTIRFTADRDTSKSFLSGFIRLQGPATL